MLGYPGTPSPPSPPPTPNPPFQGSKVLRGCQCWGLHLGTPPLVAVVGGFPCDIMCMCAHARVCTNN